MFFNHATFSFNLASRDMKTFFKLFTFTFLLITKVNAGQFENQQVEAALKLYINGTSYNDQQQIKSAFARDALLLLDKTGVDFWPVPVKHYASWFSEQKKGQFNGRIGEVLSIDIDGNIATAKVEILIPTKETRYVDMFLLKKLDTGWKVISKTAASSPSERSGERILFIVSNAHFHGDTQLPAGVSFGEIVKAFDTFIQAGYTVDFVSPKGGAIPLAYVNTSIPVHKQYLYNRDFMYAIGNTKTPEQIDPSRYKAVHYIGGTNAMYGVADNQAIQDITMEIYEKHGGIISSVCHGTAGIVNLKTKDGKYLVNGKRISGYPEAYENQSKAYFKEFPFFIQKTVEERGGHFFYSERNTPHVEVDGRVVTGQNHLSSAQVATKMIELLRGGS